MKVMIAGGAGYIGSTIAYACSDAGISPVILDSLVTGRRELRRGSPSIRAISPTAG
jgi:UDP-glucose 4-epimerase